MKRETVKPLLLILIALGAYAQLPNAQINAVEHASKSADEKQRSDVGANHPIALEPTHEQIQSATNKPGPVHAATNKPGALGNQVRDDKSQEAQNHPGAISSGENSCNATCVELLTAIGAIIAAIGASATAYITYSLYRSSNVSTQKQLRPYIGVERVLITSDGVKFFAKNYGETPALGIQIQHVTTNVALDVTGIRSASQKTDRGGMLCPGSDFQAFTDTGAISGKSFFLSGIVYYHDVFDVKHETVFQYKITGFSDTGFDFWMHAIGNEAT